MVDEIIIKSLIKDVIINEKLLIGLEDLGFNTICYNLSIRDIILDLLEIEISDEFVGEYYLKFSIVGKIDLDDTSKLQLTIDTIYSDLMLLKILNVISDSER